MYMQIELAHTDLVDQGIDFTLEGIGEQDARLDGTLAETCGAELVDIDTHSWAYTLTGDLHESEFRQRQDVMACSVFLHVLTHALVEQLTVLGQFHVDKVDDDDAAHIPESELACQLVGSSEIGLEGVSLLTVLFLDSRTAVHVDYVHGLCVFDNQISSVFVVDGLSKARRQLLGHIEIVENGYRAVIELNDILLFGCDESQIVLDFVVDAAVVYVDSVVSGKM